MVTSVSHSSQKATVVSPNAASVSHGNLKATMVSQNAAPLFVKIFTERRALAKAALQAGVRVISIDHEVVQPFAPMVVLDHTTEGEPTFCGMCCNLLVLQRCTWACLAE
jgi:hypothetical protein